MTDKVPLVGDLVYVRFGIQVFLGTIVEDRGLIGVEGRRLYGVRMEFDGRTVFSEVPEDELIFEHWNY